jgi:hypothetical protein
MNENSCFLSPVEWQICRFSFLADCFAWLLWRPASQINYDRHGSVATRARSGTNGSFLARLAPELPFSLRPNPPRHPQGRFAPLPVVAGRSPAPETGSTNQDEESAKACCRISGPLRRLHHLVLRGSPVQAHFMLSLRDAWEIRCLSRLPPRNHLKQAGLVEQPKIQVAEIGAEEFHFIRRRRKNL